MSKAKHTGCIIQSLRPSGVIALKGRDRERSLHSRFGGFNPNERSITGKRHC